MNTNKDVKPDIKRLVLVLMAVIGFQVLFFFIWSPIFHPSFQDGMLVSSIFAAIGLFIIIFSVVYIDVMKKQTYRYRDINLIGWSLFITWGIFAGLSKFFLS